MATLLNVAVTTAVSAQVGSTFQLRSGPGGLSPVGVSVHGNCTGTAGTSMQWWLQASLDGGSNWCDVASFTHVAAGRAVGTVTFNPSAGAVPVAATDGTMTTGSVANVFGNWYRVKYTTVGTWTTGNLRVDVESDGMFSPAGVGA
jgi:hypothetical protein